MDSQYFYLCKRFNKLFYLKDLIANLVLEGCGIL